MTGTQGQGSAGNVLAAICSVIIPGLGQLVQGRFWKALKHVIIWGVLALPGLITFGALYWITALIHIWSAYEAAKWKAPSPS